MTMCSSIKDQGGAGISIGANCPWTNDFEVYNNVLINTGLAAEWDGVDPDTSVGPNTAGISIRDGGLTGTVRIYNNTIIGWNDDDLSGSISSDPLLTITGARVSIDALSPAVDAAKTKPLVRDIYGRARVNLDVGAVEF